MADTIVTMTSPEGATLNTAGTYCEGNIEVVPKLQSKTATTGEIVKADAGYAGLDSVDTNPVFEAGKKSEYDAFWDAVFADPSSIAKFAGSAWNEYTFKPNRDVNISGTATYAFYQNGCNVDLVKWFEELGFSISFDNIVVATGLFMESLFTRLPVVNLKNAVYGNAVFQGTTHLVTIDKVVFSSDGNVPASDSFDRCQSLQNIIIDGTINQNGFNFSWSPLSKASLTSIVNALSSTTTGLTVTLRLAAVNTAFETTAGAADGSTSEEWTALIATKPNWTINLINS